MYTKQKGERDLAVTSSQFVSAEPNGEEDSITLRPRLDRLGTTIVNVKFALMS